MRRLAAILALGLAALSGCSHERIVTDAAHPEIEITSANGVKWRGGFVDPDNIPALVRDAGFTRKDTINIRIPSDTKDYRMAYYVMRRLVENGFSRPILVKDRRSYSEVMGPKTRSIGR